MGAGHLARNTGGVVGRAGGACARAVRAVTFCRYVACLGGVASLCATAQTYLDQRDFRFAATLLAHAVAAFMLGGGEGVLDNWRERARSAQSTNSTSRALC